MTWKFDSFTFDGRVLYKNGSSIRLPHQLHRLLQVLVKQASRNLPIEPDKDLVKRELAAELWPNERIEEKTRSTRLSKAINKLNEKLGLCSDGRAVIIDFRINAVIETIELPDSALGSPSDEFPSDEPQRLKGVNWLVSPYPGPQEFRPRMAHKFFGRNMECEILSDLITKNRVIVVNGPSGAGKSSLLNTLIQQKLEKTFDVLPGARLGGALPAIDKDAEIHNIFTLATISSLDLIPNPMSTLSDGLASSHRRPDAQGRVLILDQFEELFTQHPGRHKDKAGFFEDLADALTKDESLRVIIAIRNEYLANLEVLTDTLPEELRIERFRLLPLDLTGIAEAITLPIKEYARFAEGVVDEIISQLNVIKVRGSDGAVLETHGESIELVHLQIVCQRLWERLPEGVTQIEMKHLRQVAGESQTFREFVVNALDEFYNDVVRKVANRGGYPEDSIFFGCMQFITSDLTRTTIPLVGERVGRLPYAIVRHLAEEHLLTELGGTMWYQLAHDRLVEPISRRKDKNVDSLLYAADLLEKVLRKALAENGNSLKYYFESHQEIVSECRPFLDNVGIYKNEAELIFRSSLVESLEDAHKWSRKLNTQEHLQVRIDVLREALQCDNEVVRRHAANVLGKDPVNELLPELVRLAIDDDDGEVRKAAADSIAALDTTKLDGAITQTLFDEVTAKLQDAESQYRAEAALSRISISAYKRGNVPIFKACFRNVSRLRRMRIRAKAVALQLWEGIPNLLCMVIPAGAFAAVSAAFFKLVPSFFGWALTQKEGNAGPGFFQGLFAGVVWAGLIVLGLTIYYIVSAREHTSNPTRTLIQATAIAAVSGLLGSLIIILVIVAVFDQKVLESIGWVMPGRNRFSAGFWKDPFFTTRFAWPYLITGCGLGVGMAITIHRLRSSPEWNDFKNSQLPLETFKQTRETIRGIMRILNRPKYFWPLPVLLFLAGCTAFCVPVVEHLSMVSIRAGSPGFGKGIIGDVTTQAVGAYFGIVGMGLGIVIVRCGFNIKPRRI